MTNTNSTSEKGRSDAGIKFPCGNFETMLKAIKEHKDKNGGKFDCSAIMKNSARVPMANPDARR